MHPRRPSANSGSAEYCLLTSSATSRRHAVGQLLTSCLTHCIGSTSSLLELAPRPHARPRPDINQAAQLVVILSAAPGSRRARNRKSRDRRGAVGVASLHV